MQLEGQLIRDVEVPKKVVHVSQRELLLFVGVGLVGVAVLLLRPSGPPVIPGFNIWSADITGISGGWTVNIYFTGSDAPHFGVIINGLQTAHLIAPSGNPQARAVSLNLSSGITNDNFLQLAAYDGNNGLLGVSNVFEVGLI